MDSVSNKVSFIGQLCGDGECLYFKTDIEETRKFKPFLDEWRENAIKEMEDYDESEKREELIFIHKDETSVYLGDIATLLKLEDKKYKFTIIVEPV